MTPTSEHKRPKRVPIDVNKLRAAWLRSEYHESWLQLAQAAGISHAALSKIFNGKTRHPRRVTVEALAATLHVPFDWLAGDSDPLVPFRDTLDLEGQTKQLAQWPPMPASSELALSRLMERCRRAFHRDFRKALGSDSKEELRRWEYPFLTLIFQLASSRNWGARYIWLYTDAESDKMARYHGEWAGTDRAMDQATVSLASVWETLLDPWFEGYGTPNWDRIIETYRVSALPSEYEVLDALRDKAKALDFLIWRNNVKHSK